MNGANPSAFICYARSTDKRDQGFISDICRHLLEEIKEIVGPFDIHQDLYIGWGKNWKREISEYIMEASFLIPIITPSFFNSEHCLEEVKMFLDKENELGRDDLILPIYYIDVQEENFKNNETKYSTYKEIFSRNMQDFRDLRKAPIESKEVQERITILANNIKYRIDASDYKSSMNIDKTSNIIYAPSSKEIDGVCSYKCLSGKFNKVGLISCDLKMKNGTDTKTALDDVKTKFSVMAATASKFVKASNFESVVKRCGASSKKNVKFLLADPDKHANTLKKRASTIPKCNDHKHIINSLMESLEVMAKFENFLEVKFYPEWAHPTFRAFFVDERYALVSFYQPTIRTTETPQLKISSEYNNVSFYRPFSELFDIFWTSGTEVNLDKYR